MGLGTEQKDMVNLILENVLSHPKTMVHSSTKGELMFSGGGFGNEMPFEDFVKSVVESVKNNT